jgi:type I restriction enzyme, S subunit
MNRLAAASEGRGSRWKPYPAYKESGVEWLARVPAHWNVKKIKRSCLVRRGASPRPIDDPAYFDDSGSHAWVRISDVTASDRYLERTEQRLSELGKRKSVALRPGDLFVSIAATVGKPIITRIPCCIHDGFVYFVGLRENQEYLYYLFACGEPYRGLGKLGTQLNLNTDTIGDIRIPIPPEREQQEVVAFLDRQTSKLDALIEKKERLIELLQEKRAALITHAVTKGLDRKAPMKDSGVEWLGRIPAHWEIKRMAHLTALLVGFPFPSDAFGRGPEGTPLLRGDNVTTGRVRWGEKARYWVTDSAPYARYLLRDGDIVIGMDGSKVGRNYAMTRTSDLPVLLVQRVARLRARHVVERRFVYWAIANSIFHYYVDISRTDPAIPHITRQDIAHFRIAVPPLEEQRAIATFIEPETAKIDTLIVKIKEGIERVKEYRIALISAAVTGKIDVREEVGA